MKHLKKMNEFFFFEEDVIKDESKNGTADMAKEFFPKGAYNELTRAQKDLIKDPTTKDAEAVYHMVMKIDKKIDGQWKKNIYAQSMFKGVSKIKTTTELLTFFKSMYSAILNGEDPTKGSDEKKMDALPKGFLRHLPVSVKSVLDGKSFTSIASTVAKIDKLVDGKWGSVDVKKHFKPVSKVKTHNDLRTFIKSVLDALREERDTVKKVNESQDSDEFVDSLVFPKAFLACLTTEDMVKLDGLDKDDEFALKSNLKKVDSILGGDWSKPAVSEVLRKGTSALNGRNDSGTSVMALAILLLRAARKDEQK